MNISSAFLKQVLATQDFESWSLLRKHYLASEYHSLFSAIEKHCEQYHKLPTIEQLKLSIRDGRTKETLYAIDGVEVDTEAEFLLDYLKNEYTQKEILDELETYIDNSVAFENAEESLRQLHQIVLDVEEKVEIQKPQDSMQNIPLWEDDDDIGRYLSLGLNNDHDSNISFSPRTLILVGGASGAGKSNTCANIANNVYSGGKTAIYFTIEMDSIEILQRCCSIATGVSFDRLRKKNLSTTEQDTVATWWAGRFSDSNKALEEFLNHRDFDKFHNTLKTEYELLPTRQIDVVYDPSLTIGKIRSELDKKIKSKMDVGVVIVDYINQVKRSLQPSRGGQYEWTEQIEVSKALKSMAQEYETPVFSPYQTDSSGGARFAKGILDAADAAYSIDAHSQDDECMTFNCVKMRSAARTSFTSTMNWQTLKIGPDSALSPAEKEANNLKTGEDIDDI